MSSAIGKRVKISVFGESHGKAIGTVIDGLPAGEAVDEASLIRFLDRRRPGKDGYSTQRSEADLPIFLSGLKDGKTTGSPLAVMIENADMHSADYSGLELTPRPSHADFSAHVKYSGNADMRGGGHFSGRLTAPVCIAGGIAKQILSRRGIEIGAHVYSIGGVYDSPFDPVNTDKADFDGLQSSFPPVLNMAAGKKMLAVIKNAADEGDSVGGVIECAVTGIEAGYGSPMFDGVEGRIAAMLFGIPAVKGVEFGSGFGGSLRRGSENNDEFCIMNNKVVTKTNHHGGILGGITTGMPIIIRAALKPTPSVARAQRTINLSTMTETELIIKGRHDPCIVIRAVPVIEAAVAAVILDLMEGNE